MEAVVFMVVLDEIKDLMGIMFRKKKKKRDPWPKVLQPLRDYKAGARSTTLVLDPCWYRKRRRGL